ncbi:MAG: glycosyltransferase family 2 protein [Patescibacteria group bacterium]
MENITIAIATYNEEKHIKNCLSSVADFAGEIIVVDGGSTDNTATIAKEFGAKVIIEKNPLMFHINKQKAIELASKPWILQLDADECLSAGLIKEISEVTREKGKVEFQGFSIPRKNFFMGRWLSKGGQYPDYVVRLFQHGKGRLPCKSVHEQIEIDGIIGKLKHPILHYTYDSVGEYWRKAETYTDLSAGELLKQKISVTFFSYLTYFFVKPVSTFALIYFRHKGFVDGYPGFLFALFSGLHFAVSYKKYLLLLQREKHA